MDFEQINAEGVQVFLILKNIRQQNSVIFNCVEGPHEHIRLVIRLTFKLRFKYFYLWVSFDWIVINPHFPAPEKFRQSNPFNLFSPWTVNTGFPLGTYDPEKRPSCREVLNHPWFVKEEQVKINISSYLENMNKYEVGRFYQE